MHTLVQPRSLFFLLTLMAGLALGACGGGGDGDHSPTNGSTLQTASVAGTLRTDTTMAANLLDFVTPAAAIADVPATLYLDNSTRPVYPDGQDRFRMTNVADGDHTLYIHLQDGTEIEFPFRMAAGRGLDFGMMTLADGQVREFTGFNGYHFGWVDEDGDGINDNFVDVDGDGICDNGYRFAGYAYHMDLGYRDANRDGLNDHFADADGDGVNDLTGHPYGFGFGYVDEDGDGINDRFVDADGVGICDLSGMPFQHPFGWVDENGDGVNDNFVDADGDGINDRMNIRYVAMPGWTDLNEDGVNDFFVDQDGDGVNDLGPVATPYGHGFGWVDADGDGVNDRFVDEDGDGINDLAQGPFAGQAACYGFMASRLDADGDGFDDVFVDANGDGVNDYYGYRYDGGGYRMTQNFEGRMGMQDPTWPMGPGMGMMN